jgi:anti-sigma regulatory factor (Ser/Thr protein kinase)
VQVLQVQLEIRPDPAEVGRARRWARSRLAGSGIEVDEALAETLVLLVSELVTNAVVHTGRPAVLRLSLPRGQDEKAGESTVRLEVADSSSRAPVPRCLDDDATGGRGLALVDGLADRWGWVVEGPGKRIWCELDRCTRPVEGAVDRGTTVDRAGAAERGAGALPEPAVAYQGPAYGGFAYEAV